MAKKLPPNILLEKTKGWTLLKNREAITKTWLFQDFNAAFSFMTRIALKAEALNHHPEWSNVYNRVCIILTTHDMDGLSDLDLQMADFIDSLAENQPV